MSRRRLPAAERREQLLDACASIVDTEGFPAATIERVADACGVTRTVVYQMFGGLDGLLERLVERATERARTALAEASAAREAASLDGAMSTVLAAVDADPVTWRMFLVAPRVGPPSLADNLAAGRALIRAHNVAAIEQSDARPSDPELAARLLQPVADELVRLRLADPALYPIERLVAAFGDIAYAILGSDRPVSDSRPQSLNAGSDR